VLVDRFRLRIAAPEKPRRVSFGTCYVCANSNEARDPMRTRLPMTATCACGKVEIAATGAPMVSAVCYCADCQRGSRQIEELPHAGAVRDADGGTSYILFRKDRFRCVKGAELLKALKLKDGAITNRMVATCCNSAMFLSFDKGPHWVSAYRARFRGDLPPVQMRICTKSRPADAVLPTDLPNYPSYPAGLVFKLLVSRVAMAIGR
jgi:hypothetical protein